MPTDQTEIATRQPSSTGRAMLRRLRPFRSLGAGVALLLSSGASLGAQTQTWTFNSRSPGIASVTLTPGIWSLQSTGGSYDQVFGLHTQCDALGANCYYGWLTLFDYRFNGGAWIDGGFTGQWASPELAEANAPSPEFFTIGENTQLDVTLLDTAYQDNVGSMDVTLTEVNTTPEPASIVLVASGLLGVGVIRRHRKRIVDK